MIFGLFRRHNQKKHADSLANFLPNDNRVFVNKFNDESELRKLLIGMAGELMRAESACVDFFNERDIATTEKLIEEWERAVGIPDCCFPGTGSLEERRTHAWIKFAYGAQTTDDFERLGRILGVDNIQVKQQFEDTRYPPYDVPFIPVNLPTSRFTVVVSGTGIVSTYPKYDVPFIPQPGSSIITCLFDKLKPANVKFIYQEIEKDYNDYEDLARRVRQCCRLGFTD